MFDFEKCENQGLYHVLHLRVKVGGETGEKRVIDCFDHWVLKKNGSVHEPQRSAKISEADVATFGLTSD